MSGIRYLLLVLSITLVVGCEAEEEAPVATTDFEVEFGRATVQLTTATDTITMDVEVAESDPQRSRGLMQRTELGPDEGMIFLFPEEQPADGTFWMYNTLIPLSIAFVGSDGAIGSIVEMEPCTSPYAQWCPQYEAGVPFTAALEADAGYFAERGIGVGDKVVLQR